MVYWQSVMKIGIKKQLGKFITRSVDMITGLLNQTILQGVVPAEWELNIRGKAILQKEETVGDLTDQILKIAEKMLTS